MFNYASTNRKGHTNAKNATLGMVKMALKMSPITIIIFFLHALSTIKSAQKMHRVMFTQTSDFVTQAKSKV